MNRRAFAARIAASTELPAAAILKILDAIVELVAKDLANLGRFEWRGLGTFTTRRYPARTIHNPSTGQLITLQSRTSVAFKPSKQLRAKFTTPNRASRRIARRAQPN